MFLTQNYSLDHFRGLEDADDLDQSHDLECAKYSHFSADRLRPTIGHALLKHGKLSEKHQIPQKSSSSWTWIVVTGVGCPVGIMEGISQKTQNILQDISHIWKIQSEIQNKPDRSLDQCMTMVSWWRNQNWSNVEMWGNEMQSGMDCRNTFRSYHKHQWRIGQKPQTATGHTQFQQNN